jgi:glycosyltransferase involved in cell wall biosynthesis
MHGIPNTSKMKLIYMTNARVPSEKAHGIQTMKMCEAFTRIGYDVELIVPKRRNPLKEDPFAFYGIKKIFSLKHLPTIDIVGIIPRLGFFIQLLSFLISAKLYLQTKKWDVLYSRDVFTNLLFKNTYLELHTLPKRINLLHIYLYKKSKRIIVLTQIMKDSLGTVNIESIVSPDAVDIKQFSLSLSKNDARKKLLLPKDKKIIMYTGHLYPWKGVDTLFEAAKLFDTNYDFVFVGGTKKDIEESRKKTELQTNITIKGAVPQSDIPRYLKAADIVVLPNSGKFKISTSYTSPMKLFEYMASGTPMVASDLPSLREVIDEKSTYFFKADDAISLAHILREALSSKKAIVKALHAREVVSKYTWDNRAKRIISEARV